MESEGVGDTGCTLVLLSDGETVKYPYNKIHHRSILWLNTMSLKKRVNNIARQKGFSTALNYREGNIIECGQRRRQKAKGKGKRQKAGLCLKRPSSHDVICKAQSTR